MEISLTPINWWCPLLIWLLLLGFFLAICLAIQDGFSRLKRLHQIPCNRCAFYTGEYRLKCTVNPYGAFTENAIACRDWEARKQQTDRFYPISLKFCRFLRKK
jgi:hypothetical protein